MAENPYLSLVPQQEPAVPNQNPYDDLVKQDTTQRMRGSLLTAVDKQPDSEARLQALAKQYNLPVDAVRLNQPDVERRAKVDSFDYDSLAKQYPATGNLLSNPQRAAIAHDDVDNLTSIEGALKWSNRNTSKALGALASGVFSAGEGVAGAMQAGADYLSYSVTNPMAQAGVLPVDIGAPVADAFKSIRQGQADWKSYLMPKADSTLESGVYSGLQSLSQNLLTIPFAVATGNPELALNSMAGITGGLSYGEARDAGKSVPDAITYGAADAAIEYGTEKFGVGQLFKDLKAGSSLVKTAINQIVPETLGEEAATALQDFNAFAVLHPEKTLQNYIDERPEAAIQTLVATLVGSGGMVATLKAADQLGMTIQGKTNSAMDAAKRLETLNTLAAESKVMVRDRETVRELVNQAILNSDAQNVFIDAQTFAQSGVAEELAAAVPEIARQLPEALETGGEIRIPMADYVTSIAGTEYAQSVIPHLRLEGEEFSHAAAQSYIAEHADEMQQVVEQTLAGNQVAEQQRAGQDLVKNNIVEQLNAAGTHTPQANEKLATLVAKFYAVQGEKLGKSADVLFDEMPFSVNAVRNAGGVVFGNIFNQSIEDQTETPEFKNWFGESKVVDAEGKPLVVYRGIAADTSVMRTSEAGMIYTTTDANYASDPHYGGKSNGAVYPLFLKAENLFDYANVEQADLLRAKKSPLFRSAANGDFRALESPEVIAFLKDKGFDGYRAIEPEGQESIAVFNPTQLKSAIGNKGTFDPNDPNILNQSEGQRGAFNPATRTITLLPKADLSTFLHETGHLFLELQFDLMVNLQKQDDLVGTEPAEKALIADTQKILDWFGLESLDQWYALDFEEKRSYHEKFAEGFEKYLFEGKAPSFELARIFANFRQWLKKVYGHLKDHFKHVQLDDEVRGVFDRMLATDAEIELASKARSMMPLFEDQERSGMSAKDFADYQATGQTATDEAKEQLALKGVRDMQWLQNARNRELNKLQRKHDALRREIRSEVRAQVWTMPVYQAWGFLTRNISKQDKLPTEQRAKSNQNVVDETQDSLFVAIAKLGGLSEQVLVDEWGYDNGGKIKMPVFGKPVVRKNNGDSLETMAEKLVELGYLTPDSNGKHDLKEFENLFNDELRGNKRYSTLVDGNQFAEEARAGDQVVNPSGLGAGRIDLNELKTLYTGDEFASEVINKLVELNMTAKDGLHPDIIAEIIPGFSSGDELMKALARAVPPKQLIEQMTDERMLENYGELATPEAIRRAADEAIHNEVRARFVTTEYNALAQATGSMRILGKAAQEYAEAMINRIAIKDLSPIQYSRAEVRAAKNAAAASKDGNLTLAASEKRNQIINNQALRAAYKAQDDIDAALKYFKKLFGDNVKIDVEYLDQIEMLLSRFDLRKTSKKFDANRKSLANWIDSQRENGIDPDLPAEIMQADYRKPYKDLTIEEFRGLVDTVKQIEHLGRLKNTLLTQKKNRDFDQVKMEIVDSIIRNAGDRTADNRTPTTYSGKALQGLTSFFYSHIKAAQFSFVWDGGQDGGAMWEYFIRGANQAGEFETTRRADATLNLTRILEPVFKRGKMGGKGVHFPTINRSLNREQVIAIALNTGNDGNMQRLLDGEGWSVAQVTPVLQTLTAEDWRAVQQIWDYFESYRPEIAAKERRVYGKEPNWVEPKPVIVQCKNVDGEEVELRLLGGYYPIKYDPVASQRAEQHADAEDARRQMQGAYTAATTRRSFTKTRADQILNRPLLLSLEGLFSGVNEVLHDLAWHEWLIDTNKLLKSASVDNAIRTHYGAEPIRQLKAWVKDIAEGDKKAVYAGEQALARLRQGISAAGLGFNVMSAVQQITGFNQSIVRIGAGWVGQGIKEVIASPKESFEFVNDRSEFMRNRGRTQFRELNELRNAVQDESSFDAAMRTGAFYMMQKMQRLVDVPTWIGAFNKALASGNDEERAAYLADQAVIDAQGSGQTKDLSAIERGGPAMRLFTVFYSFMNTTLNLAYGKSMTASASGKLAAGVLLYCVPAILMESIKQALVTGDDDWEPEELGKKMVASGVGSLFGQMVVLREFSEAGKMVLGLTEFDRGYHGPAGIRLIDDATTFAKQAKQAEFDDAFFRALINLGGDTAGLPAAQINRTYSGVKAINEGDTQNPAALVFGFRN